LNWLEHAQDAITRQSGHTLYRHRLAATGAVFLILGAGAAGCAHNGPDKVATATPAAAAVPSSTTTTTAPATTTTAPTTTTTAEAPAPHPTTTVAPQPASITVKYQPHDGGDATATLEETGQTLSLADGSAVFSGLAPGTYTVHIEVVYPTDSAGTASIGAMNIFRAKPIAVQAGDHAVISCDDNDCTGVV